MATKRTCIVIGCEEEAGTPWGPYFCARHDAERLERIAAGLAEAAERLAEKENPVRDSFRRIPVAEGGNALTLLVTQAQWDALIVLADRTQGDPKPRHLKDVFPENDARAAGMRTCLLRLKASGLLYWPDFDGDRVLLRFHVRSWLDRYRYAAQR